MFYSIDILQKRGKFGIIWLAATSRKRLSKRDYRQVDVILSSEDIQSILVAHRSSVEQRKMRFSLYLSSQLMYGLAYVHKRQCDILVEDLKFTVTSIQQFRKKILQVIDLPPNSKDKERVTLEEPNFDMVPLDFGKLKDYSSPTFHPADFFSCPTPRSSEEDIVERFDMGRLEPPQDGSEMDHTAERASITLPDATVPDMDEPFPERDLEDNGVPRERAPYVFDDDDALLRYDTPAPEETSLPDIRTHGRDSRDPRDERGGHDDRDPGDDPRDDRADRRDRDLRDDRADIRDRDPRDDRADLHDRDARDDRADLRDGDVRDDGADLHDRDARDDRVDLRDRDVRDDRADRDKDDRALSDRDARDDRPDRDRDLRDDRADRDEPKQDDRVDRDKDGRAPSDRDARDDLAAPEGDVPRDSREGTDADPSLRVPDILSPEESTFQIPVDDGTRGRRTRRRRRGRRGPIIDREITLSPAVMLSNRRVDAHTVPLRSRIAPLRRSPASLLRGLSARNLPRYVANLVSGLRSLPLQPPFEGTRETDAREEETREADRLQERSSINPDVTRDIIRDSVEIGRQATERSLDPRESGLPASEIDPFESSTDPSHLKTRISRDVTGSPLQMKDVEMTPDESAPLPEPPLEPPSEPMMPSFVDTPQKVLMDETDKLLQRAATEQPDADIQRPTPEQPDADIQRPTPEQPDADIQRPTPEQPDADIQRTTPEQPDDNLSTALQELDDILRGVPSEQPEDRRTSSEQLPEELGSDSARGARGPSASCLYSPVSPEYEGAPSSYESVTPRMLETLRIIEELWAASSSPYRTTFSEVIAKVGEEVPITKKVVAKLFSDILSLRFYIDYEQSVTNGEIIIKKDQKHYDKMKARDAKYWIASSDA